MQRLYLNTGGYRGEQIDIEDVLRETEALAAAAGWDLLPITVSKRQVLPAFKRSAPGARKSLYISAGVHGDEPAGPLAVRELFREHAWPEDLNLWVVPCLNPAGFQLGTRENEDGVDLNRDYLACSTDVVRAHTAWLDQRPNFDVTLLLHEDWESHGFYLYELNPDRQASLAEAMINAVKDRCPVDLSPVIEGREAQGGVICVNRELPRRHDWPEAFYLVHHKTRVNYTLEAPSDFPLPIRVQALMNSVRAAVAAMVDPELAEQDNAYDSTNCTMR